MLNIIAIDFQILVDDPLSSIKIEEDLLSDEPAQTIMPTGTITAVFEVDPYLSCPRKIRMSSPLTQTTS